MAVFTIPFAYTGNANVDLLEIVAPTAAKWIILGFDIGQTSDTGDAAEEILALSLKSGQSTSGSGGSTSTPVPTDCVSSPGSGAAAEQANTTKASTGTILTHAVHHWNVRMPLSVVYTQEQQTILPAGRRATLEIPAAADSLTISGQMWVQEF